MKNINISILLVFILLCVTACHFTLCALSLHILWRHLALGHVHVSDTGRAETCYVFLLLVFNIRVYCK